MKSVTLWPKGINRVRVYNFIVCKNKFFYNIKLMFQSVSLSMRDDFSFFLLNLMSIRNFKMNSLFLKDFECPINIFKDKSHESFTKVPELVNLLMERSVKGSM